MKKALSLFLAGLMVASLAACGNNAESQPATDENKTVADQSDMAAPQEIEEGTPVYADVLNDGTYDITVESSSSMFNIEACQLTVADGKATAPIEWSSSNYDYMKVDDVQYDPVNTEGNSVFEIPVSGFDWKMPVLADTTAMSTPHEIDYTLTFDSASLEPAS